MTPTDEAKAALENKALREKSEKWALENIHLVSNQERQWAVIGFEEGMRHKAALIEKERFGTFQTGFQAGKDSLRIQLEAVTKERDEYLQTAHAAQDGFHKEQIKNDSLRIQLETVTIERDKLNEFKKYVHSRLDLANVPKNPDIKGNEEHGCRIEWRLNYTETRLVQATKERDYWKESAEAKHELEILAGKEILKLRADFKSSCELVAILKIQLEAMTKDRDRFIVATQEVMALVKEQVEERSTSRAQLAKYRDVFDRIAVTADSHETRKGFCVIPDLVFEKCQKALASDPTGEAALAVIRRAMDLMQEIEDLKFGYYGDGRELAEEALAALKAQYGQ